ncbi:uncharacterized protein LY89DRAFT_736609 [Mollisia scopiformis]|uniref:Transmembrane protein n=1 Tax=Mollisia scopiformis TaxID=149040 RepID=A0A194X323_MOLSC|nr:uncharacterized protein LY89DRAFT_736609 [Mollisia scopiformis]KUJ14581.1 hypothetical protein LY89DRAFT_736609 [Mollisia scopiformis]
MLLLITILIFTLLTTSIATPIKHAAPASTSSLPPTASPNSLLDALFGKDAGSLSQLPPQPWPPNDNQSKKNNLVGTVCGVAIALGIVFAVLYLRWMSRKYGRAAPAPRPAPAVVVTRPIEHPPVTHARH